MLYRWIAIVTAAVGWASIRTSVHSYSSGGAIQLYNLATGRPFDRRVLPSILDYPLVEGAGMCVDDAVWLVECGAAVALLALTFATLRPLLGERPAAVATGALLPVLGLVQFGPADYVWFAPYDTPACAFVVAGLYLALRGRYGWLTLLCIPAALNRETAIMLPLTVVALRPQEWRRAIPALAVVLAVRLGLHVGIPSAGGLAETAIPGGDGTPLFLLNMIILCPPSTGAFAFLVHLSGLPLLWAAAWRDIPADLRRLGWVSLAVAVGMLFVGGVNEPRVFAEPIVLAWAPIVVGTWRWARRDHAVLH